MSRKSRKMPPFLIFDNPYAAMIRTFRQYCLERTNKLDIQYITTLWYFSLDKILYKSPDNYDDQHEALVELMVYLKTDRNGKTLCLSYFAAQNVNIETILSELCQCLNNSFADAMHSLQDERFNAIRSLFLRRDKRSNELYSKLQGESLFAAASSTEDEPDVGESLDRKEENENDPSRQNYSSS